MHSLPSRPEAFRPAAALQALDSPTRRRLLQVLQAQGPTDFTPLADQLQISSLKLNYHLGLLEEAGLVRFRKTRHRDANSSAAERTVIFRAVGWARMKKLWGEGMQGL